jgi:hypothetical protein
MDLAKFSADLVPCCCGVGQNDHRNAGGIKEFQGSEASVLE